MKKAFILSAIIMLAASAGCRSENISTESSVQTVSSPTVSSARTPEQDLAVIDGNGRPIDGSEAVIAALLDRAEPKCTEGRRGVADLSVKAVEVAKSKGARTSNFDMLTGALKVLDLYDQPQECLGVFAALVVSVTE
ncbi:MAG TPA: hypothetical protein VL134_01955 [Leptolyngbya sp.]|jgi:hypothetical protein|nr:hypothetical protein [Leptolyngbya sp.]